MQPISEDHDAIFMAEVDVATFKHLCEDIMKIRFQQEIDKAKKKGTECAIY